jgi:hypothetical protein
MPDCTDPRPHRGDYELDCGCPDRDTRWAPSEAYLGRLAELQKRRQRAANVIDLAQRRRRRDLNRPGRAQAPPEADQGALPGS